MFQFESVKTTRNVPLLKMNQMKVSHITEILKRCLERKEKLHSDLMDQDVSVLKLFGKTFIAIS